jgi:hypothetical protein
LLQGVEGDHPDRIVILTVKQIEDHRFQIGGFDVGFPISAPVASKIVDHEVDVLIVAMGTIDGVQPLPQLPQMKTQHPGSSTKPGIVPA